jgi:hypothetical protein
MTAEPVSRFKITPDMKKNGVEQVVYANYGKGVNLFTRDTMINDDEAAAATNVWSIGKNSIAKRPGTVHALTLPSSASVVGIGAYYDGTKRELLAMSGGKLYRVDPVAASSAVITAAVTTAASWTTNLRTDMCQAGGKVFMQNGTDPLRYYDGTGIANQTNGVIGKWLIYYKASLWTAGNTGSGNRARLYRSGTDAQLGDFTNSTANPFATSVYVSKDDGQGVSGFFKHQDFLYPTKERSLWRASQDTSTAAVITIELVDPARGCDSHFSIDTVENDNFMYNENGVYATGYEPNILDQIRTNILSLRIDSKIKSIQKSNIDDVVGIYHDNHYYLSYPSGGSSVNDTFMVYDRQRLGWWEWDIGANCFTEFKDSNGQTRLYFGSPNADGKIYYFDDTAKSDAGLAFKTTFRTAKLSFKDVSQSKVFLNALLYFGKTSGTITYSVYVDGYLSTTDTVQVGATGSAGMGNTAIGTVAIGVPGGSLDVADSGGGDFVKIPINKIGRNIQIEITDNTSGKTWELNAIVFQFKKINALYQPGI